MANYKTHCNFNLCVVLPVSIAGVLWFVSPSERLLLTFTLAFVYGTLFMSPDMDLANQVKLYSLKGILTLPFRSYALAFRHRGLSHSWLLGTLTRVLWLMIFITLLLYGIYSIYPSSHALYAFFHSYQGELTYAFAGLMIADWGHLLLDGQ